jgi:hypothetical protein
MVGRRLDILLLPYWLQRLFSDFFFGTEALWLEAPSFDLVTLIGKPFCIRL